MVIATAALAVLGLFADASSTRMALKDGFYEDHRIRRFLIRALGLNGGTYGVAVVASVAVVAGNLYSNQPDWSLILGNCILAAGFWWAVYKNAETI